MTPIRQWVEFLINPYCISLLFLCVGVFLMWRRTHYRLARGALTLALVMFLMMSTGWLPRYLTHRLEHQYAVVQHTDPKVHWVVVLGGGSGRLPGMPANDLLTSASMKRLIEGVRLFKKLPEAQVILSGGGYHHGQTEAALLEQVAHWFSIPPSKIVLESGSGNTADQARELVSMLHNNPFYLVTSAIHMPRAIALCQKQGLHPIAAPTDITLFWSADSWKKMLIPNAYNASYFSIAMHEILGQIWADLSNSNPFSIKPNN